MTAPIRNTRKFRIPIYRVKNQRVKTGYVLRGTPVFDPLIYLVKYRGLGGEVQVQMYTVTYTHTDAHIQTHTRTHTHLIGGQFSTGDRSVVYERALSTDQVLFG